MYDETDRATLTPLQEQHVSVLPLVHVEFFSFLDVSLNYTDLFLKMDCGKLLSDSI